MRHYLQKFIQNSWAVFAVILLFDGALLWKTGPAAVAADAKWYADAARQLAALNFDFSRYFSQVESPISPIFYIGFVTLVALCQKLLGAHWLHGVLLLNVTALALVGTLLVRLVLRLTNQKSAALVTLVLFLACLDMFNWARFVLTDTIFMALVGVLFVCIVRALTAETRSESKKYGFSALFLLFMAPFCRPTGVVLFPIVAVCFFAARTLEAEKTNRKLTRAQSAALICSLLVAVSLADAVLMQDIGRWPLPGAEALRLPYYAKLYHEGVVINARPETYGAPPHAVLEFLALSARRFVYFFAFWSSQGFSRGHNLALSIFFLPAYFLVLTAIIYFLRGRTHFSRATEMSLVFAVVFIVGYAFFHAHTEIDYDWRYRLPVMPLLIFSASLGFAVLRNNMLAPSPVEKGSKDCVL